jgi:hypothetical protein
VSEVLDKGAGSVSRWVAEGLERQLSEPTFRSQLEDLARLLEPEPTDDRLSRDGAPSL